MNDKKLPEGYEVLVCPKENCKHKWVSASKMKWVTCPKCQRKFDREKDYSKNKTKKILKPPQKKRKTKKKVEKKVEVKPTTPKYILKVDDNG